MELESLRRIGAAAVAVRDGLSKRATVYVRTAAVARENAKEVRRRVEKGRPAKDSKAMVGAFATEWVASTLAVSDRKANTKAMYATLAGQHIMDSSLGPTALARLTARKVEAWVTELRGKGLSESTVRSTYTVLRSVLDTAVRDRGDR